MTLQQRMKKYAGRLYTHEETEMLQDLQAAVRALEVARIRLDVIAHASEWEDCNALAAEALQLIDETLGEKL